MGSELLDKAGVSVYLAAVGSLEDQTIQQFQADKAASFTHPYVFLMIVADDKKIDISDSGDLGDRYDKQDIYWNSIIPLIPIKEKNHSPETFSAAMLNGYANIVHQIAESSDVELEHAIPVDNSQVNHYVRYSFYLMAIILVLAFIYSRTRKSS